MAEVVVQTKKPIFTKILGFLILLVILIEESSSTVIADDSSSSFNRPSVLEIPLESSDELLPHQISKKSDVLHEGDGKKFSTKLSQSNLFAKYFDALPSQNTEAGSSHNAPDVSKVSNPSQSQSQSDVSPKASSEFQLPGASLWKIMKTSFFKPEIARESSFSILPQLKTPKQAWDDLLANAMTGFKMSNSPFQSASKKETAQPLIQAAATDQKQTVMPLTPAVKTSIPRNSQLNNDDTQGESSNRGERGIIDWPVSTPELAWSTVKLMGGLGKGLLSNYLTKGITVESPTGSYQPLLEKLRLNQGVLQVYKGKIRDLALLNFLHKDKKASAVRNLLGDGGWSLREPEKVVTIVPTHTQLAQPTIVNSGWTNAPVLTIQSPAKSSHQFLIDASIITGLLKAGFDITKALTLAKFIITAELIKTIPVAFEIKGHLLNAVLHLLIHKDKYAFFRALTILNHSVWQGKKQFLRVLLGLTDYKGYPWKGFKYGIKGIPWKYEPYGASVPNYSPPSKSYGSCPSCSAPAETYGSYSAPPASSYGTPPQSSYGTPPSSNYGAPAKNSVPERNPLYSYPSNFDHTSDHQYATLPPIVIPPVRSGRDGQSKVNEYSNTQDSVPQAQTSQNAAALLQSFGSEEKEQRRLQLQETLLTRFIKSLDSSQFKSTNPSSQDSSSLSIHQERAKEEANKVPKFSSTLLHDAGFTRN